MANSHFQKVKVNTPVAPSSGGTGVSSLSDKGVLIGAGTGNVTTVAPGSNGNVLISNGTDWVSGVPSGIVDGTVSYDKLANDLVGEVISSGNNIDWSLGSIFTKILTADTTFTFSNYQLDKNIIIRVSGDYFLTLPNTVNIVDGVYDRYSLNYITLHCTNTSTGAEEVWGSIGQGEVRYNYGYILGGSISTGVVVSSAHRIDFSSGIFLSNTVSNLDYPKRDFAGVSDTSSYGYFAGGYSDLSGSWAPTATANIIIFSNGATYADTASVLSQARYYLSGISDGSSYGYFTGGLTGSTYSSTSDRIVFSTGITSLNTVSNLSQGRSGVAGVSDGSSYGYFAGGLTGPSYVSTADKIIFSTGVTSANTASNLSQARDKLSSVSDGDTYGYFAGGRTASFTPVSTADRITFSTGTTSVNTVSNLSQGRYILASVSDGINYGYFCGGETASGAEVYTTDRISFSNSTTSANTSSNLPYEKSSLAGLSDCAV